VQFYTAPLIEDLRRKYGDQPDVYQQEIAKAAQENLQQLMDNQIIIHEFERAGYKIPDSIVDEAVEERIRTRFGDRATFAKTLQAQGTTFEQFKKQVHDQIVISAMQRNFVADVEIISPHKILTYYNAHQDDFQVGDQVKLRMIVLNKPVEDDGGQTKRMADEVLAQLKGGAAFDQMASVYSQGSQASQGGDLGWVEKKILRKELADVAFAMKPGERSGVLEMPDGYYILLVEDAKPAHVQSLKEVQASIEKTLSGDERTRLQKEWIDKLKDKTFVRTY
ncbi:MAG TPA: peptidyl-prolyl cis-trans isomerase, partial [Verrucomicrobiae bacterium]|nr:peptidyl-prolyl cis-trans isomerase [Verrucomicrobiae bacterium]